MSDRISARIRREEIGLSPRSAWTFAVLFLGLAAGAGIVVALSWSGPLSATFALLAFVPPLLYAIPRTRSVWEHQRWGLLAAQVALTFLPLVVFGRDWVIGLAGLLGGLLLLTVRQPVSWIVFGAVIGSEIVLRWGVVGVRSNEHTSWSTAVIVVPLYVGLSMFGLVRMARLVTDLHSAQNDLAALAVCRQRQQSGALLRDAVGDRIQTATAHIKAAEAALARSRDLARSQLAHAAGIARQGLDNIRSAAIADRKPNVLADENSDQPVTPRVAWLVLLVVLGAFALQRLMDLRTADPAAGVLAGSAAVVVAVTILQVYHSSVRPDGTPPRGWRWTFAAQLVLTVAVVPALGWNVHGMAGFTAGSALLLIPKPWSWVAFAAIQISVGAHLVAVSGPHGAGVVYTLAGTMTTGLVVFGLSRLSALAVHLEQAQHRLAKAAVAQELLRVARDTHDLLGLGLSAIALKCDLVMRLIDRDDSRARPEIDALLGVADKASTDIAAVADDVQDLSVEAELASAAGVLASAGVATSIVTGHFRIPAEAEAVLAAVLREAVTNVLRHARATRCTLRLSRAAGAIALVVVNDGVADETVPTRKGARGLDNLRARVNAQGGSFAVRSENGWFHLTVRLPLSPTRRDGITTE